MKWYITAIAVVYEAALTVCFDPCHDPANGVTGDIHGTKSLIDAGIGGGMKQFLYPVSKRVWKCCADLISVSYSESTDTELEYPLPMLAVDKSNRIVQKQVQIWAVSSNNTKII